MRWLILLILLVVLVSPTPSFADSKRLGVHFVHSTELDECGISLRYKRYELFLSSTAEATTFLRIRQFDCSDNSELLTGEVGTVITGFSLSEGTAASANGPVPVVSASGTFTVFNQGQTERDVPFNLIWTAFGPLQKMTNVTSGEIAGAGFVLLDVRFSIAGAQVTGHLDGFPISNCCWEISTVP